MSYKNCSEIKKERIPVSYVLLISCSQDITVNVGSLGKFFIRKGPYAYVGSARLKKPIMRVHRHLKSTKKIKWHIDHLLKHCDTSLALLLYGVGEDELYEMFYSDIFNEVAPVIKGFGASDKPDHYTHLFRVRSNKWLHFVKSLISELLKMDRLCFMEIVLP